MAETLRARERMCVSCSHRGGVHIAEVDENGTGKSTTCTVPVVGLHRFRLPFAQQSTCQEVTCSIMCPRQLQIFPPRAQPASQHSVLHPMHMFVPDSILHGIQLLLDPDGLCPAGATVLKRDTWER